MRERLYRSRTDRMLFGVAGGMAHYFGLDPSIVRLVWVLLFIAGGAGLLLYIVAAIVVPEEPVGYAPGAVDGATSAGAGDARPSSVRHDVRDTGNGAIALGIVLVVLGAWFLVQRVLPGLDGGLVWPVVLLGLGAFLVFGALRRQS